MMSKRFKKSCKSFIIGICKHLRKVGLDMTGYGLKYTFLNLVSKNFGLSKAAEIAGHTNKKTTEKYTVDWQEHQV